MKGRFIACLSVILLFLSACHNAAPQQEQFPGQEAQPLAAADKGKIVFEQNCITCHQGVVTTALVLKGALSRWDNDAARLKAFIKNAPKTIEAGDPRAIKVSHDYSMATMTPFPGLTDDDLNSLVAYIGGL